MAELKEKDTREEPKTMDLKKKTNWWKGLSKIKKIVIVVVVVIVGIFVIALTATNEVSKTSNDFVNKILHGYSNSAYDMLSSESQKTVSKDDFAKIVSTMESILEDKASQKSKSVEGETGSSAKGQVLYEIKGSDGTYTLTVNLVKEGDEWKVLNFDNSKN